MKYNHKTVFTVSKYPNHQIEDPSSKKGLFNKTCSRTACDDSPAVWFNIYTNGYYCERCAHMIDPNLKSFTDSEEKPELMFLDDRYFDLYPDHSQYIVHTKCYNANSNETYYYKKEGDE